MPPDNKASSAGTPNSKASNGKASSKPNSTQKPAVAPVEGNSETVLGDDASMMGSMPPIPAEIREMMTPTPTESVGDKVNRLRPKSFRLQLRFLRTLAFAVWLFGRLVFWQVYVARYFPKWVSKGNKTRWRNYARDYRKFAIRMGGVHIKAGQFASTRADILPEEVIAEFADLQDRVPTIPYEQIHRVLVRELGDLAQRYTGINPQPIAAASLGQVHKAQLTNGDKVVVKVQRPNVREIIYTDLAAMLIVARIAMQFGFVSRRADAELLIEEFGSVLLEEVSYYKEKENAQRFSRMFADNQGVYVPHIYAEHSTDFVLTIEDVTSIKIDDFNALARNGIDRKDVAQRMMDTYMQQIFKERFFHADPHPGNLFVYPLPVDDPTPYIQAGRGRPFYLIFIDFGMTGTLTKELTEGLINTLSAVITRDAKRLVKSYQELGFLLPGADVRRIEEATAAVFDEVWGLSMTDMNSMDFEVVANIGKEFSDLIFELPFRVPQDFIYLGRTVSILSGMATALDPEFNPWVSIQENVQNLITGDKDNNIFNELFGVFTEPFQMLLMGNVQGFVGAVQRALMRFTRTDQTRDLLRKIIDGEVQIETKLSQFNRRQLEKLEAQGKRTTRAFLAGSFLITSTMFYTNGDIQLATMGYVATVGALVWMINTK